MSVTAQAIAHRSRTPLRLVSWASIAYLLYAAIKLVGQVIDMVSRLQNAHAGITLTFNPGIPVPQPTNAFFAGGPYVVPGSTLYLTQAQGQVADVPAPSIVMQSLSGIVSVLTAAGIALCVLLLVTWVVQGRPFAAVTTRVLTVLAVVIVVGCESAIVLDFLARQLVNTVMLGAPQTPDGTWSVPADNNLVIDLVPIYVAVALLGLAAVFRVGASLEKETEGLV
ncbi:MAG: hypothetical protein FWE39_00895 [Nocardiaceae bacterium]|nr:hypothetical protein [Nocardiaceae bacterium]